MPKEREQIVEDEVRCDFEQWCAQMTGFPTKRYLPSAGFRHAGKYIDTKVEYCWDAYRAGYALASRKDA